MALIAPIVIECIDYLAYGTIFTRAMFRPKIKLDVFFFAKKSRRCLPPWCVVGGRSLREKFGGSESSVYVMG